MKKLKIDPRFEAIYDDIQAENETGTGTGKDKGHPEQPQEQPKEEEIWKEVDALEYDHKDVPEKPIPIVSIGGQTILTRANVLTWTGGSKSGKSATLNAIQAGTMRAKGEPPFDTLGLDIARNADKKLVIHFCTEQSKYDYHKNVTSIFNRAGRDQPPKWFKSFHFLPLTLKKRQVYLENTIDRYAQKYGGVFLITIDGIGDLIRSPNDEELSFDLVEWSQKMAEDFKAAVSTVLHFNPNSENKSRGHLGSHLERKSESVLTLTKDKETGISTIDQNYLRNGGLFDPIQFEYDVDKGFHVYAGTKAKADDESKRKDLSDLASKIFKGDPEIPATGLASSIEAAIGCKKRTAYTRIDSMKELNIIKLNSNLKYELLTEQGKDDLPF